MAFSNQGGFGGQGGFAPRQMVDVTAMNLKCSECGAPITELRSAQTRLGTAP